MEEKKRSKNNPAWGHVGALSPDGRGAPSRQKPLADADAPGKQHPVSPTALTRAGAPTGFCRVTGGAGGSGGGGNGGGGGGCGDNGAGGGGGLHTSV